MLTSLLVKNFAIIDNIQIDFDNNMTVLTGETGAGKSLIIDAIGLLFGDRASSDLVRYNENKAIIEGVFDNVSQKVNDKLLEYDLEVEEVLVIRREIFENGKSICKINGNTVSLSMLQDITEYLGNIHTQFDAQKLVNPKNYLSYIDNEKIQLKLTNYRLLLKEYNDLLKELSILSSKNTESVQKLDFYKFQINELDKANLSINEEEDLKMRFNVLNNFEKIAQNITEFKSLYQDKDNKGNTVLDAIYSSISNLERIEKYDFEITNLKNQLSEYYYSLDDLVSSIINKYSNQDFDNFELDEINSRLAVYSDMKRKYRMSIEEIIDYHQKIKKEISEIDNYDFYLNELNKKIATKNEELYKLGKEISDERKQVARKLSENIVNTLSELQLKNTTFEIKFTELEKFGKDGIDNVDFLVTFNKGEPLKSLSKIASGGELSRFMLAIKSHLTKNYHGQTLIFDEIDNGVSGLVAYSIANKIKNISRFAQVLCVTHLPQVAAISDHQLKISKTKDNERTSTSICDLSYEKRVIEIAMMISNGDVTDASKNLAIELLNK